MEIRLGVLKTDNFGRNTSAVYIAIVGGNCNNSAGNVGAFLMNLNNEATNSNWNIGACLSFIVDYLLICIKNKNTNTKRIFKGLIHKLITSGVTLVLFMSLLLVANVITVLAMWVRST